MAYKYFISYTRKNGFGNGEVRFKKRICSIDSIREIEEYIEKSVGAEDVTINNFILLEESEGKQ